MASVSVVFKLRALKARRSRYTFGDTERDITIGDGQHDVIICSKQEAEELMESLMALFGVKSASAEQAQEVGQ